VDGVDAGRHAATAMALDHFARAAVDVAVLEVGLGGRLDATNLIDADVAVLASVGFDHRDWLGDTLELIGAEKAGIFRTERPAVLGTPQMPASVYQAIAQLGARPVVAEQDFRWQVSDDAHWNYQGRALSLRSLPPPALAGAIQYRNAATALAAAEVLCSAENLQPAVTRLASGLATLDERTAATALGRVRLPGRFQVIPGEVEWILDIAHNEPAARVLAAQLRERPPPRAGLRGSIGRTFAVIGVLADKDAAAIGAALAQVIDRWIVCALPGPRGTSAAELAGRLAMPAARIELAGSIPAGCALAREEAQPGDRVIVCGSVYAVGPALQWLGLY